MKKLTLLVITSLTAICARCSEAQTIYEPYVFTTVAGKAGVSGATDGPGPQARLSGPSSLAFDQAGNLYVAEAFGNRVRKLSPTATNWMVSTVADLPFDNPQGIVVDQAGNIFLADFSHFTVREVIPSPTKPTVLVIAGNPDHAGITDGTGAAARFNSPSGLAMDALGNIYVSDYNNNTIRQITAQGTNWVVTTIAGHAGSAGTADGPGPEARFSGPTAVAADTSGNLYVTEGNNHTVRKITKQDTHWVVSTLAGQAAKAGSSDGFGTTARFNSLQGVRVDRAGTIYVADVATYTVRKLTAIAGETYVTTLGGRTGVPGAADGTGEQARFNAPAFVCADYQGHIYVADNLNNTIRMGSPALAIASFRPNFGISGGRLSFDLAGPAGQRLTLEASSDLVHWLPVSTNQLPSPVQSPVHFQDTITNPFLFYRARTP